MKNNTTPIMSSGLESTSVSFNDLVNSTSSVESNYGTIAVPQNEEVIIPNRTKGTYYNPNNDREEFRTEHVIPAKDSSVQSRPSGSRVDELIDVLDGKTNDSSIIPEAGKIAIDFMLDNNLLALPDDVVLTPDNLQEVIEYTKEYNIYQAIEYIVDGIEDPTYKEAIRATIKGGTMDDAKVVQSILEWETELNSIDLTKEVGQRNMLKHLFYQELNEKSPVYELLKASLDNNINNIIASGNGEKEATKALNALRTQINTEKSKISAKLEAARQAKESKKLAAAKKARDWQYEFLRDLRNSGWDPAELDKIMKQVDKVEFEDGTDMYVWEYKLKQILSSATNAKMLFRFLNNYDYRTKSFNAAVKSPSLSATDKILSSINVNNSGRNTGNVKNPNTVTSNVNTNKGFTSLSFNQISNKK